MKTKTVKVLPKTTEDVLNGGVYSQRVRCGKPNCRCARGELHIGYYFFTRRSGKFTKMYVRKADVEAFTIIVDRAAAQRLKKSQSAKDSMKALRRMRLAARERERHIKLIKENQKHERI